MRTKEFLKIMKSERIVRGVVETKESLNSIVNKLTGFYKVHDNGDGKPAEYFYNGFEFKLFEAENDLIWINLESDLPSPSEGDNKKVYVIKETNKQMYSDGTEWIEISGNSSSNTLISPWALGKTYELGEFVTFRNRIYKCVVSPQTNNLTFVNDDWEVQTGSLYFNTISEIPSNGKEGILYIIGKDENENPSLMLWSNTDGDYKKVSSSSGIIDDSLDSSTEKTWSIDKIKKEINKKAIIF